MVPDDLGWPLSVPVLTDGRVTLRAHVADDIEPMVQMCTDADTVRWTAVPVPYTTGLAHDFAFGHMPAGWDAGTVRGWAIECADAGIGASRWAGNIDLRGSVVTDLGVALHPGARGQGVMSAAVRLVSDWAFLEGGVDTIHWRTQVGNVASLRVAHACGFAPVAVVPGLLHERGRVLDAWTAVRRFGDPPGPRTTWHHAAVLRAPMSRLRPLVHADAPRIEEAWSDPQTRHWMNSTMPRPGSGVAYVDRHHWMAATGQELAWAVADPDTDRFEGVIAVHDLSGHDPTSGEISYWLHPSARGRGLLRESLPSVVRYALSDAGLGRRRLTAAAAADNTASLSILAASGFTACGRHTAAEPLGDGSFSDLVEFELLA